MGRYFMENQKEMGFPDEFGVEMTDGEQEQPDASQNQGMVRPFCGYLTSGWFGPFLLSPVSRRERGWC